MTQLELTWYGGAPEARFRRRRPGIDELPWGSIDPSAFAPEALLEARKVWTNGAFTEYASAAAFSAMTGAFLECGAPIDLVAAAADVVVDEMSHVELASRLVMELGGAVAYEVNLAEVAPLATPGVSPLMRAAELVVTTACVSEALSVPILARSRREAEVPLVRAVLNRLSRDEGPHARVGTWFLGWAQERLSFDDLRHLGEVALGAIAVYAPLWQSDRCRTCHPLPAFGGIGERAYRATMTRAVRSRVVGPLRRFGIEPDVERLAALLS